MRKMAKKPPSEARAMMYAHGIFSDRDFGFPHTEEGMKAGLLLGLDKRERRIRGGK